MRRNLGHIETLLAAYLYGSSLPLPNWLICRYRVLSHLYDQQYEMYKISVSLTGDKLHWRAQHAGHDLQSQVEAYKKRYGYYSEVVIADRLYGARDNRSYLERHHIRFSGKPLGRAPKVTTENQDEMKRLKVQRRQEYRERIPIEGKFGQGKYGYRLNNI